MQAENRTSRVALAIGAVILGLLAWQGHHLARWLPHFEQWIESLGPWGPAVFCVAVLLLTPLLVPDTLFGVAAGAAFGVCAGAAYYLATTYLVCLVAHWLGLHWMRARVLRLVEARAGLRALLQSASRGGARFTFLVRLVPVNPAALSYALGAAGVPLRSALVGNVGMFVHMLPTVYFGAAAVHVTRMAAASHRDWEIDGALLMLGLAACVVLSAEVTRHAWKAIDADTPSRPED